MIQRTVRAGATLLLIFLIRPAGFTQEKWDLRRCVEYAFEHNISVRQADLQIRFAELDLQQTQLSRFGAMQLSSNLGYSSGRNQDPTSFDLITLGYVFNNYSLQASVDIFNWFSKKYTIEGRDLDLQSRRAGLEKAKNDVALNIAIAYLQVLLAREQAHLSTAQVEQTRVQLESTRRQVDAGNLPELSAANLEAQLATDSTNLINAETLARQYLLQMKALLNMDPALPFDIITPPVELIPVESLADLQPEYVFKLATSSMPQQLADSIDVQAALKYVDASRGAMYPTISIFGSLGSTFNNRSKKVVEVKQVSPPIGIVTVNGTDYTVFPSSPFEQPVTGPYPYFEQLNENFRQSIGIGISVPIFNGGLLRSNWKRSKLNVQQAELVREQNSFTLKQDIYTAYNDAVAALQKFNASRKAVETAQKAYDFAVKRYELGLLSTYDLITTQTTLAVAKSQLLYAQYDYVFKIKLLEFYKGQGLKL
jgi:outer membrane protein